MPKGAVIEGKEQKTTPVMCSKTWMVMRDVAEMFDEAVMAACFAFFPQSLSREQ